MIEVEIKIPIDDIEKLRNIIKRRGTLVSIIKQNDIYFQHPSRDFSLTDEALRLREEDNKYQLTYKGPKISEMSKTRTEITINVNDFNKTKQLLEYLGFKTFINITKIRETYKINESFVSIDYVNGLGYYAELEKEVSDIRRVSEIENELINLAKDLGLDVTKNIRKSYLELLLDKNH
jgi:adenylate cyclase class 2